MNEESTQTKELFAAALSDALRHTASARSGVAWESRLTLTETGTHAEPAADALAVAIRLRGELTGELVLCMAKEGSDRLLSQPEGTENAAAAWLSMLENSTDSLEKALHPTFSKIIIENCRTVPSSLRAASLANVTLHADEGVSGSVRLLIDEELQTSLFRLASKGAVLDSSSAEPAPGDAKLHRVIDVPLAVTLRFGQRQLTLRELLDLNTGSLVELDRQVEEPVELMLGERIVARGEVVIVDGNYGLRVTEVVENAAHGLRLPSL